ncbi:uncharacterized protein LOC128325194 [Hemicordylus capensis]|uniref:uncharacterized protein LOC128325194 n=1 Tax=Hemicordylus capensis TaxID=884348 RepID=UPI0023041DF8|nr:uncharacterized protein LOC128325194 [Hemicordylus capensis]XP_053106696.1 uncharacterized protein LOC128325194 [Hemicordylus capensis]XP_053106697.1 uncharacterized protein LOC128325194 [Hemicordylus capensis]
MSSTQKSCTSTLSLKDIMENGFLIGASGYSFSPGSSCFLEMNMVSKLDAWDSASNVTKGSSLVQKLTESSLNSWKGDLQASFDGAASFCKTPNQPCVFDLSNLSSANNSKNNSIADVFCDTKSSTPCKEDKPSKLAENLLKSSERNDPVVFKKLPPPPVWEISRIQDTVDHMLSLEASLEELVSLGSMKTDTLSLEMAHFTVPLSGNGVSASRYQAPAL